MYNARGGGDVEWYGPVFFMLSTLNNSLIMPEINANGSIHFVTQGVALEYYASTAMAVLVFYDYFLTLALEIQNIWRKPFRFPTLIFLLNRYLCIALSIALIFPTDTRAIVFGTFLSFTLALFFALRTYALWGCNRVVFVTVILAYIPGFSMNLCTMLLDGVPVALGINELVPLFFTLFDILVLLLSLAALRRSYGSSSSSRLGALPTFFLQHARIREPSDSHLQKQPLNAGVMYAFSSVLVSRFMLRLGEASSLPHHSQPSPDLFRWGNPSREMIVGNLAGPFAQEEIIP
ncbi:hypothetical protein BDY19DRAFT_909965 [Irpex rosettiformis]|uniref:Uncharacterized protein n=1 Tax=Irpex rosettiformis TaxID=378272 RepID=A0ACB8TQM6_9APHY|nr:hypothetical protein BDY19DRAFT_909965 [Irpex rosettiformis]